MDYMLSFSAFALLTARNNKPILAAFKQNFKILFRNEAHRSTELKWKKEKEEKKIVQAKTTALSLSLLVFPIPFAFFIPTQFRSFEND